MSHPFGDQGSQPVHRKQRRSLSKLAWGIDHPHSVVSLMRQGQRRVGPQARERVVAIIGMLQEHQALTTLGNANGGLHAAVLAEQLVISPRTVNWHLTSIYRKLGVSSRSAATRYAIEHQLA